MERTAVRRALLLLLVACGPAFAPVTVRLINNGPEKIVLVSNRAEVRLHPECGFNCELRGGLSDGGHGWAGIPQQRVDAGVTLGGEPQFVDVRATVSTTISWAPDTFSGFTSRDGGFDGVPNGGQIIIVEILADGGVALGLELP